MGWGDVILGAGTLSTGTVYDADEMKKTAIQAGEEGIVMVKNENGALPLRPTDKVAVFGAAQFWESSSDADGYHFGGIGSGAMWGKPEKEPIKAITALAAQGKFTVYSAISNKYESQRNYTPTAKDYADAKAAGVNKAIVFITRYDGEGDSNLNPDGDEKIAKGDWYLSRKEEALIQALNEQFEHVIAVMNTGDVMDTNWIKSGIDGVQVVDAALFSWYGGTYGAIALANILSGDASPSGKLAETAADIYNYPTTEDFDNKQYTAYTEDVFLGYRYFETFNVPVNYEFGFGLSYTDFEMSDIRMSSNATHVTVKVTVKNTGNYVGKEVVQVYFSAPQKGVGGAKLAKPAKELAGYAKTDELKPGQYQEVTVKFPISELASYDDTGVTGKKAAWVMEAGDYKILVGNSVKNVKQAGIYKQNALRVVEQLSTKLTPQALGKRLLADGSYETLNAGTVKEPVLAAESSKGQQTYPKLVTFDDVKAGKNTVEQLVSQMTIEELASFTVPSGGKNDVSVLGGSAAVSQKYGISRCGMADGPAGINTYMWSFPSATSMACTWNLDLLADFGTITGKYGKGIDDYDFWLAPGVNMQRNPLGGRNYEYFSEDALVTGLCATAITVKCQAIGISVTAKHYVANDKELARGSCDSRVSERAMREIYLRPFEFLVKVGKAASMMTGYNVVNGTQIIEYPELLALPREEWGWDGFYMSDSGDMNSGTTAAYIAGIQMALGPVAPPSTLSDCTPMVNAYNNGKITRAVLEKSAATILTAILRQKTGYSYKKVPHYDPTGEIKSGTANATTEQRPTTATVGQDKTTTKQGQVANTTKDQAKTTTKQGQVATTTKQGQVTTPIGGNDTVTTPVGGNDTVTTPVGGDNTPTTTETNPDGTPVTTTTATNPDGTPVTTTTVEGGDIADTTTTVDGGSNVGGDDPTATAPKGGSLIWLYILIGVVVLGGAAVAVILILKKKKTEPEQE